MPRPTSTLLALAGLLLPCAAVTAPAHAAGETCDGRPATHVVPVPDKLWDPTPFVGTPGDDVIVGTTHRDVIDGAGGNDVICGLAGHDVLTGGEGHDRLFGGLDAEYSVDDGYYGDLLVPGPGDDFVDLGADADSLDIHWVDSPRDMDRVSYADAPGPVTVDLTTGTATGHGNDTLVAAAGSGIVGSPHDDTLRGNDLPNAILGGSGADVISAGDGHDHVEPDGTPELGGAGDRAADAVDAGAGDDYVYAHGDDEVHGGADRDFLANREPGAAGSLSGGSGRDKITAAGATHVWGGGGNDRLDAAVWPRTYGRISGGGGRDRLILGIRDLAEDARVRIDLRRSRALTIKGQPERVRLSGVERTFVVAFRQRLRLTFMGSRGADRLGVSGRVELQAFGGGGADVLGGGGRSDLLDGGPGRDRLDGSSGRDRCVRGERVRSCEVRR